jgi:hypothetical protein
MNEPRRRRLNKRSGSRVSHIVFDAPPLTSSPGTLKARINLVDMLLRGHDKNGFWRRDAFVQDALFFSHTVRMSRSLRSTVEIAQPD